MRIHVSGHVNSLTDAIASAMGIAWLLQSRDGADVLPARAGPVNQQTSWVLHRLGLEAPGLVSRKKQLLPVVLALLEG